MDTLLVLPLQKSFESSFSRNTVAVLLNKKVGEQVDFPTYSFGSPPRGIILLRKELPYGNFILVVETYEEGKEGEALLSSKRIPVILWLSLYGNSGILKPVFSNNHKVAPGQEDPDYAAVMREYERIYRRETFFSEENFEALGTLLSR